MKRIEIMFSLVILGLLLVAGLFFKTNRTPQQSSVRIASETSLAKIAQQCASSVGSDGFGVASVKGKQTISHQSANIGVPCRLQLYPGAALTMLDVALATNKLFIGDNLSATQATSLSLTRVMFKGNAAGLQISLKAKGSRVDINRSQLNYPLSVGVAVGADEDVTARLSILGSELQSTGNLSEGIVLVSTGRAIFKGNKFSLSLADDAALLVAPDCQQANNKGPILGCINP